MLASARWLAATAVLIGSDAAAQTIPPECFLEHRNGAWTSDCSAKGDTTYCFLRTGGSHLGLEILTRTSALISPPEARLVFTSDALALRPGDHVSVEFQFSKESPETEDAKASSPTSVAIPMNIVSLAFWSTSGKDPDTMTFTIEGKDHVLTFRHSDFGAALDRVMDCIDGK